MFNERRTLFAIPEHNQYISLNDDVETDSNDGNSYCVSKECKKIYYIMSHLFIFLTIILLFAVGIYLFNFYVKK
jgi:membrane protein insertase Oxa1/YidC/SpoIIIJ